MQTSFFKVFFSKKKECDWLNSLGQKGHLLTKISDSKYFFEVEAEHIYYYSIEHLDYSPSSDTSIDYFNKYINEGVEPIISHGNWVYFVKKDNPIKVSADTNHKNAKFYLWKAIYQFFFAICGAVLCGYQFFAAGLLERLGQQGDGLISDMFILSNRNGIADTVLNIFKRVANYLFDLLNLYFKVWANAFGANDAYAVIAAVLPLVIILTIIGALNLNEYISFRVLVKKTSISVSDNEEIKPKEEGVSNNAEQTIQH